MPLVVHDQGLREINVVNFLRGVEPRGPVDLFLPLQRQMEVIRQNRLPATWLLQFDALVSGPFVAYLKANMPKDHEVGIWFEMNEMHCRAAGVEWRGRPGYEWDYYPSVAFTIGYGPEERVKLADAFMQRFAEVWGRTPKSVASWNLDSITIAHLANQYGVDAFAVCRDQIATDGFTIWGAPIAGYYPSKVNCWSPAVDRRNQIDAPIFRMLGQDPVYYYENGFPMPGGKRFGAPVTMEPVWVSGRSQLFIERFLEMIEKNPALRFAYAQLGQENNFGWPAMADAYPRQMAGLAAERKRGAAHVETMGETGRRFKQSFRQTPAQAQVMLRDPFGNTSPEARTIWYQSRFYRANLHLPGNGLPCYLRDITVYSDRFEQPFLHEATRLHEVEQRMPAVLDAFHWKKPSGHAGGFFLSGDDKLVLTGLPSVREQGNVLLVTLPTQGGKQLRLRFEERLFSVTLGADSPLTISFEWDPAQSALTSVEPDRANFCWRSFDYSVGLEGRARQTGGGWELAGNRLELHLAQ